MMLESNSDKEDRKAILEFNRAALVYETAKKNLIDRLRFKKNSSMLFMDTIYVLEYPDTIRKRSAEFDVVPAGDREGRG